MAGQARRRRFRPAASDDRELARRSAYPCRLCARAIRLLLRSLRNSLRIRPSPQNGSLVSPEMLKFSCLMNSRARMLQRACLAGADALLPHMTANLLTADRAF